jgi:hypothetical protein
VFKKIIAPVQAWLLSQGKCVGCGQLLAKGKKQPKENNTERITCKCGRIYIFDKKAKKYHRALFEEV